MEDTFGKQLQRWREAANISQAELARRIDISATWVSNLERDFSPTAKDGKPQPSVELCDKIAHALGVKIAEVRLAAGYAPPHPSGQAEDAADQKAQEAARAAQMVENFLSLSPERQTEALAVIKIFQTEHSELLKILGPDFKVKDWSSPTQPDVEETPSSQDR